MRNGNSSSGVKANGAGHAAEPRDFLLADERWRDVCGLNDIFPGTGAAALIDGIQVAIVRMPTSAGAADDVYAIGNFDPFSRAYVIARGIVGDRGGVPKIASPIYKQSFDLRTGACLDDPAVALPTWPVRVREGRIEIYWRPGMTARAEAAS